MTIEKYEWRKAERNLYPTMKRPSITTIPEQTFLTLTGQGDPNTTAFKEQVAALYAASYAIKMAPKKQLLFPGAFDYTVYPLEGNWTLPDDYQPLTTGIDKQQLIYQIMIKQPAFVTPTVLEQIKPLLGKKVAASLLAHLQLTTVTEGLVGMMLHVGSFDTEAEDFERLDYFLHNAGYQRTEKAHKEIYLSDFRRVDEAKRKTILRVKIAKQPLV
ncbi:GyrI-like domain-containing protein [Furfurilactobacillus siliginis]|uniref:GyrI-like small molecule binding domain-containing protein n=1 Tax=Furfurilactobacillus siliginis TaxID=348151 RepID=A0A0R2L6R6_9LACO|nr:GyrI-like domain-containing protein [Furfurilactobacillus siliginis]KRN97137.1 hypothetical protein IV55_GL000054 [Furfurilactobacillus siliginis]GEK29503.1 hypothetical protein LSI01_18140 [Furfurilactobacillus siliginis]